MLGDAGECVRVAERPTASARSSRRTCAVRRGRRRGDGLRPARRRCAGCAGRCTCRPRASIARRPRRRGIWMAWSMIWQTRSGIIALHMWTHTLASRLPSTSIALAAFSTIRRMASISMRARETTSRFLPSCASGRPKASRDMPRRTMRSSARSAWPTDLMQWWMRPGPRRPWKSRSRGLRRGGCSPSHAAVVELEMHVAVRRVVVAEQRHRLDDLDARRVLRHQDLRLLAVRRRIRVGLHHRDHDLAAGVASAEM